MTQKMYAKNNNLPTQGWSLKFIVLKLFQNLIN